MAKIIIDVHANNMLVDCIQGNNGLENKFNRPIPHFVCAGIETLILWLFLLDSCFYAVYKPQEIGPNNYYIALHGCHCGQVQTIAKFISQCHC